MLLKDAAVEESMRRFWEIIWDQSDICSENFGMIIIICARIDTLYATLQTTVTGEFVYMNTGNYR
jgi:hypothetical protein